MGYGYYGYNSGAKKLMVNLYVNHGYSKKLLVDMFYISRTSLNNWIKRYENEEDLEEWYDKEFIKNNSVKENKKK